MAIRIKSYDFTPELIDEGPAISRESDWVDSWEAALKILDKYPWHRLYPIIVHPDFAQAIWQAVKKRLDHDTLIGERPQRLVDSNLPRWHKLCGRD
ncbi:MAG TPA: hypothetical protein VGU64_00470 [Terriglobales bacterium]|nr:hypothetical protein [Terriglobales bacterium]